ncbi:FadR family transcriptional regulator [Halieaceae bacterium IMCC14734]|uniref:FadR family transcriptional regulator n=1 Tax=Candidatus Litorirhabdus singularis TaxID=2518993 RepID=A0ABT3TJ83_9GAMM|nr:FadR/GntR family transcriptional regulator [Candidatus Litorirhabdus singularis]MCX2981826.1 FadR family transcriptional regulator [Candidatus Litorirhabdus singularis]
MHIEAVKVRRLYLQVAEQLSRLIAEGELLVGERLPSERDLAARFGVSRPTVREAMITMEISGLVEIRSGSGVYVLPQSSPQGSAPTEEVPGPLEVLEARRAIEGETAALAAARITETELTALQQQLNKLADASTSIKQKEAADQQFHQLIAAASGNSALHSTIVWLWQLRNQTSISNAFHEKLRAEGSTPVLQDHTAILDSLRRHDAGAARNAMHTHLNRVIDYALKD